MWGPDEDWPGILARIAWSREGAYVEFEIYDDGDTSWFWHTPDDRYGDDEAGALRLLAERWPA